MTYEDWKEHTAIAIYAASFVRQYHDHFNTGAGPADEDEIKDMIEEAASIVDSWREVQAP